MNPTPSDYQKAKEIYFSFLHKEPVSMTPYLSGLGNVLFLVDEKIVIRIKKTLNQEIDSLTNEKNAFHLASEAGLSPKLIAFLNNGDAIYKKDDGEPFLSASIDSDSLIQIGRFIKRFHSLNKDDISPFDAKKHFDFYKDKAEVNSPLHSKENEIRSLVEREAKEGNQVISHNDIVHGNLLKKGSSLCLIDFEYAGTNSPYFDLASLLSENNIEGIHQKKALLKGYFGEVTEICLQKCDLFIAYEDLLWAYWALARFNATKSEVFLSVYKEKRKAIDLHAESLSF